MNDALHKLCLEFAQDKSLTNIEEVYYFLIYGDEDREQIAAFLWEMSKLVGVANDGNA